MSEYFIQYNFCPREDGGRGGFIFGKEETKTVGPFPENEVELKAIELMADANTVPSSVQVFREETMTAEELIQEISEILNECEDGDWIAQMANNIVSHPVSYEGDSMFKRRVEDEDILQR